MKTKIWVLSTCLPEEFAPCLPHVFGSISDAEAGATRLLMEDWEHCAPCGDDGEKVPWPGDWTEAANAMVEAGQGTYSPWELSAHDVEVPVPQAFRDLLTLAQGLDEFRDDYRMNAVLRACEAIVEGRADG